MVCVCGGGGDDACGRFRGEWVMTRSIASY